MIDYHCISCECSDFVHVKFDAKAHFYNSSEKFQYFQCDKCGMLWRNQNQLVNIKQYGQNYYSFTKNTSLFYNLKKFMTRVVFNFDHYLNINLRSRGEYILYRIIKKLHLPKMSSILDVGCGGGEFLERMSYFGYKRLLGIDPYGRESISRHIQILSIEISSLVGEFELINAHHVIEHTNNPISFLREIYRCLSGTGKAVITFPVYGSTVENDLEYSYLVQAPDHNFLMTPKSFSNFCDYANLKIEYFEIDCSGLFEWLVMAHLWRSGHNFNSYHKECLKHLTLSDLHDIHARASTLSQSGNGGNHIYVVSRKL